MAWGCAISTLKLPLLVTTFKVCPCRRSILGIRHWQHPNLICSAGHCHSALQSLSSLLQIVPPVMKVLSSCNTLSGLCLLSGLNFLKMPWCSSRSLSDPYPCGVPSEQMLLQLHLDSQFTLSCGQHCPQSMLGRLHNIFVILPCGNLDLRAGAARVYSGLNVVFWIVHSDSMEALCILFWPFGIVVHLLPCTMLTLLKPNSL